MGLDAIRKAASRGQASAPARGAPPPPAGTGDLFNQANARPAAAKAASPGPRGLAGLRRAASQGGKPDDFDSPPTVGAGSPAPAARQPVTKGAFMSTMRRMAAGNDAEEGEADVLAVPRAAAPADGLRADADAQAKRAEVMTLVNHIADLNKLPKGEDRALMIETASKMCDLDLDGALETHRAVYQSELQFWDFRAWYTRYGCQQEAREPAARNPSPPF